MAYVFERPEHLSPTRTHVARVRPRTDANLAEKTDCQVRVCVENVEVCRTDGGQTIFTADGWCRHEHELLMTLETVPSYGPFAACPQRHFRFVTAKDIQRVATGNIHISNCHVVCLNIKNTSRTLTFEQCLIQLSVFIYIISVKSHAFLLLV